MAVAKRYVRTMERVDLATAQLWQYMAEQTKPLMGDVRSHLMSLMQVLKKMF